MYRDKKVHLVGFNNNLLNYCINRDPWNQLILSRLLITNNDLDRITKREIADLYYHKFNRQVSDDTARDEGFRVQFKYNKNLRSGFTRELFVYVRIKSATNLNQTINEL